MHSRRDVMATLAAAGLIATPAFAKSPPAPDTAPARSPFLTFEGRTADMPGGKVRLGFPGVVIHARFQGSRLVLKSEALSDKQWIDIQVDSGDVKTVQLTPGAQDLVVYDGPAGDHTLAIARRNESWEGAWDISGVSAPAGKLLPPPALPRKKLLFIGDSVTCGAACDVTRDDPRQDSRGDDGQKTYAKVLAKRLDAQCHLVSYGGRGVIRDWQGSRDVRNAPQFYELAAPDEPTILWNPADYVPDAIGIMLGTNDFNQGIPDQNEFVNAYVQLVEKVRRDAPKAPVFLIDSPIVTDGDLPKRTVLGAYIADVVRRLASALVSRAPIGHYAGRPVNAHPIAEDHIAIAGELEPLFRKALS